MVSAARIEPLVWDTITAMLRQPGLLLAQLHGHQVRLGARQVEVRSELAELRRQLAEVTRQEGKLLDLCLQDDLLVPQLRERLDEYGWRRAGLQERLARAEQAASSQAAERGQADALRRLCRRALRGLATLSPEGRQQLLRALVDEVRVSDTSIEIHGIIPVTLPRGR